MSNIISEHNALKNVNKHKQLKAESYNCRIALWQIPYDNRYSRYDTDNSKWFESVNKNYDDEIENVEKKLNISLSRYKTYTQKLEYSDDSILERSIYPNGNVVQVTKTLDYVMVSIKNKVGQIVAEKVYNYTSNEGRKTIYKYYTQGENTFTVTRVFSYDTRKNRSSDIVNYGYTSLDSKLTDGCTLEKEYYTLNGQEVEAVLNDNFEYCVTDKQGKKLTFTAE